MREIELDCTKKLLSSLEPMISKYVVGKTSLFLQFSQLCHGFFSAPPFPEVIRLRECRLLSSVYRGVRLKGEWRSRRGGDECNLQLSGDRQ